MNMEKLGVVTPRGVEPNTRGGKILRVSSRCGRCGKRITESRSDLAGNRKAAPLPHGEPRDQHFSFESFHVDLIGSEYGLDFNALRRGPNPNADRIERVARVSQPWYRRSAWPIHCSGLDGCSHRQWMSRSAQRGHQEGAH